MPRHDAPAKRSEIVNRFASCVAATTDWARHWCVKVARAARMVPSVHAFWGVVIPARPDMIGYVKSMRPAWRTPSTPGRNREACNDVDIAETVSLIGRQRFLAAHEVRVFAPLL